MNRSRPLLFVLPSMLALSGCIAAAIPVVAGGAVARSTAKGRAAASTAPARPADPPRAAVSATPPPPPLPSDPTRIRPGQFYTGTMPPPVAAPATPTPTASALPGSDWSDVGHHLAAELSPDHGVLLVRGSDTADPRWLGCKGKPPALLATVSAVMVGQAIDPAARQWLEALRVMEVRPVLIAATMAEAAAARQAFAKAELGALTEADTLMLAASSGQMPAIRADVGARYCVLALVGRTAADFPNGLTPATTPPALAALWGHGWFLLPGGADSRP